MLNLQLYFDIWLLLVIILAFVKIKWAVSLFVAYTVLVPFVSFKLFGSGDNAMRMILLIGYLISVRKINSLDIRPFVPFITYYVILLCMIPFQFGLPFGQMTVSWVGSFFNTLTLPILIWNISLVDKSSIKLFRSVVIICIVIAICYGLFLTSLNGVNPYIMMISALIGSDADLESYFAAEGSGRLFGRISSVFMHPMHFGLFIGLSLIYVFYLRKIDFKWRVILEVLTILMSVFCGVRSVIGGLIVVVIYYLISSRNFKVLLYFALFSVVLIAIVSLVPDLSAYLGSILDINNNNQDVNGSSVEMRLNQLDGVFDEASKNPFFGLGFGWTGNYLTVYGDHPICLAFESLLFVTICNGGILGVLAWIYLVFRYYRVNKKLHLYNSIIVNALMYFYVSYALITGDYGYMKMFLLFYTLLLIENLHYDKKLKRNLIRTNGKSTTSELA